VVSLWGVLNSPFRRESVIYLVWQGEIIDETEDRQNAVYLVGEYNMAYGGGVSTTTKPSAKLLREWRA
jgi:hypothetical protein